MATITAADLLPAAENALIQSLAVKPEESVLLIYDQTTVLIAEAFSIAAENHHLKLTVRHIELSGHHGGDPDPETCRMMLQYDVIICPTYYSLTHCAAMTRTVKAGKRAATLPGIDNQLFMQLGTSPELLQKNGQTVMNRVHGRRKIRITSNAGTDLEFTIGNSEPVFDTGLVRTSGEVANLPGGELYTAPDLGIASGRLVVDGSIGSFSDWTPESPNAIIEIRNGSAFRFEGTRGTALQKILEAEGKSAFAVAEFGIGTNPEIKLTGNLLGDEKVKGTIHIAFGNNVSFGGFNQSTVHIDVIILHPCVFVDGEEVMHNGEWRF